MGFHLDTSFDSMFSRGTSLNVAVEVRVQESAGTIDQKNEATVRRYARIGDERGMGAVVLHVLCPRSVYGPDASSPVSP